MGLRHGPLAALAVFAVSAAGQAAPPALDIPVEVRPVGGYVRFTPKTDAVSVFYVADPAISPFPSDELKDARRFLLPVSGVKSGRYKVTAVAAGATGEQTAAEFWVVIGDGMPAPVDPKVDPKPDPVKPPAGGKLYFVFLVDRAVSAPAQQRVIGSDDFHGWLKAGGHEAEVFDLGGPDNGARAKPFLKHVPDGSSGPWVVAMTGEGPSRGLVRGSTTVPETADKLIEWAKGR
ncbi:MAG: hypothetical protein K2X82_08475 [Gemmataceae bacterium]|nr:hypothetical protein [Gemmataceae bacterium]